MITSFMHKVNELPRTGLFFGLLMISIIAKVTLLLVPVNTTNLDVAKIFLFTATGLLAFVLIYYRAIDALYGSIAYFTYWTGYMFYYGATFPEVLAGDLWIMVLPLFLASYYFTAPEGNYSNLELLSYLKNSFILPVLGLFIALCVTLFLNSIVDTSRFVALTVLVVMNILPVYPMKSNPKWRQIKGMFNVYHFVLAIFGMFFMTGEYTLILEPGVLFMFLIIFAIFSKLASIAIKVEQKHLKDSPY